MILYENTSDLETQAKDALTHIENNIKIHNMKKINLLKILETICSTFEKVTDIDNPNELLSILDNLKLSLEKVRYNIEKLEELSNLLKELESSIAQPSQKVQNYNEIANKYEKEIFENNVYIENFFNSYISFHTLNQENFSQTETIATQEEIPESKKIQSLDEIVQSKKEVSEPAKESKELSDNDTLLISETKGKVFLPYKIQDLEEILQKSNKYSNLEEVINDKYILPISYYKNAMFSRFKEGYNLMRTKERASFTDSLSLALELSVNTYLNPAIITACSNLDELDIYLDYLSENQTEKFKIFKIEYEILPTKKSRSN